MSRVEVVKQAFKAQFNYAAANVFHGPARVNLIGDHTDYNDGFVLPAAINFGTDIAATCRTDRQIRVLALDCNNEYVELSLDELTFDNDRMWVNYVAGTLLSLMKTYPNILGADLVVSGNVPLGAGLSSSASFEIAILRTFSVLYQLPLDGIKAALMGQEAENDFVGCNCGIMDQLISAMGQQDHAMLLDCRSLTFEDAPIPEGLEVVIVNSNVKRGLVDSEYNTRRKQCEEVADLFGAPALRDITMEQLEQNKHRMEDVAYRRAKHVISENARTEQALQAMKCNDIAKLSELMKGSHQSLRDDFEVTTKELDGLVELIDSVLGNTGGVRMTGGGFGGCVVALAPTDKVPAIISTVQAQYPRQFGLSADIFVCTAASGAFR